ncbi:hypothetical protein [Ottowia sp.]|uniref:hypothetical protein n=1 Tax=Ottowia sp. TaxID=1898956 RepID=UPI0039E70775
MNAKAAIFVRAPAFRERLFSCLLIRRTRVSGKNSLHRLLDKRQQLLKTKHDDHGVMAFAFAVEMLDIRMRRNQARVKLARHLPGSEA